VQTVLCIFRILLHFDRIYTAKSHRRSELCKRALIIGYSFLADCSYVYIYLRNERKIRLKISTNQADATEQQKQSLLGGSAAISISAPVSASLPSRAPRDRPGMPSCSRLHTRRCGSSWATTLFSNRDPAREWENVVAPTRMHAHVIHSLPSAHVRVCVRVCAFRMRVRRYTWSFSYVKIGGSEREREREREAYIACMACLRLVTINHYPRGCHPSYSFSTRRLFPDDTAKACFVVNVEDPSRRERQAVRPRRPCREE